MLVEALLFASALLSNQSSEDPSQFEIAEARIGMSYEKLRSSFPNMRCKVSCTDDTVTHAGYPGTLWAGIGDSAINHFFFVFRPGLSETQAQIVRQLYITQYGEPSRVANNGCEEWDKAQGAIALCLRHDLSHTYWRDEKFMQNTSVIPGDA